MLFWFIIGVIALIIMLLQFTRKETKLSDKIRKYIKQNPGGNPTYHASQIAGSDEFNNLPFNVAEEYCFLISEGCSVQHLDDEYDCKVDFQRND